ncbi:MAG: hypothetical protein M1837_004404 [Sclerophora amabilis]|nr:MAG: hypothetical protein M1837_004404 [Sclerophora amabilis]
MTSSGAVAVAHSSNRRAQPMRQTRTNPPRSSAAATRSFPGGASTGAGLENDPGASSAPGFFPAITHFTDSITALPKEIVRHFTLLKEVDAKAFGPEENLAQLIDLALATPAPDLRPAPTNPQEADRRGDLSGQTGSRNENLQNGTSPPNLQSRQSPTLGSQVPTQTDPPDLFRRQLFYHIRCYLSEMLVTLDEKNHVISTANEALQKQLSRADSSFPYIDNEISEEARYGSLTHWAYTDRSQNKANGTSGATERSRRDVAGAHNLAAVVSAMNEEAAATRSESRREAMLAKKQRNHPMDPDLDDGHHPKARDTPNATTAGIGNTSKKVQGNPKVRKAAPGGDANVGLGITNGGSETGGNPPNKRRKAEKVANAATAATGTPMERSTSGALGGGNGFGRGGAGAGSSRETPAAEPGRKRARGGPMPTSGTRKRININASNAGSPSLASSPVNSTFPSSKDIHRSSPMPASAQRPASSRARRNSAQINAQEASSNTRNRPSSSASNKLNGNNSHNVTRAGGTADLNSVAGMTGRSVSEVKSTMKEAAVTSKGEHVIEDKAHKRQGSSSIGHGAGDIKGALVVSSGDRSPKKEEVEGGSGGGGISSSSHSNSMGGATQHTATSTASTTRSSGKASKASTPVTTTFPEPVARSRSSRATEPSSTAASSAPIKRSHKKGAGAAAQQQQLLANVTGAGAVGEEEGSSMQGDDEEDDDDDAEPRYCYCNQVSYGEMVACDADSCPREWFHLDCVGLTKAPTKNAKWYCDECKETLKKGKVGGGGGGGGSGGGGNAR